MWKKKKKCAFREVPCEARPHFILNLYGAVLHLIVHLLRLNASGGDALEKIFEQHPFLAGYFEQIYDYLPDDATWDEALGFWQREMTAWEEEAAARLPLAALEQELGIGFGRRMALMCVGLVEEDARFGTLFAQLQEPLSQRRPNLELAGRMVATSEEAGQDDPWQLFRPLVAAGLVETANPDTPRSEWILRVPTIVWDALRGEPDLQPAPWAAYYPNNRFAELDDLILPPDTLDRLGNLVDMLYAGTIRIVVLRGMQGSERLEIIGAVSRALGKNVIVLSQSAGQPAIPWALAGALCAATHSIPVVAYDMGPGETAALKHLGAYEGPVAAMMGLEGGLKGPQMEKSVTIRLSAPDASQRRRHWQKVFAGHAIKDLDDIIQRFHIPGRYIANAGKMAIAYAGLDNQKRISSRHVRRACRALNHQQLDTLAARLQVHGNWDDLIVGRDTGDRLLELENRCRFRESVTNHLGTAFQSQPNWGVRALFSGPSGTGKTLAAKILASRLSMDLYRVDLAAVINKYIGETEKNLHQVLSRAEELDVILLLDEGDTLLGKRTDVKSANDRYANLETNYLLQRLENYQGIVLITSNAGENIDPAFQRRMDMAIGFLPPEAEARWQIWMLHLAAHHEVDAELLLDVSQRCAMTGGQIRNAAQQATLLAMENNEGVICNWHLRGAIETEYRKAGALSPLNDSPNDKYYGDDLDAFVASLSL